MSGTVVICCFYIIGDRIFWVHPHFLLDREVLEVSLSVASTSSAIASLQFHPHFLRIVRCWNCRYLLLLLLRDRFLVSSSLSSHREVLEVSLSVASNSSVSSTVVSSSESVSAIHRHLWRLSRSWYRQHESADRDPPFPGFPNWHHGRYLLEVSGIVGDSDTVPEGSITGFSMTVNAGSFSGSIEPARGSLSSKYDRYTAVEFPQREGRCAPKALGLVASENGIVRYLDDSIDEDFVRVSNSGQQIQSLRYCGKRICLLRLSFLLI